MESLADELQKALDSRNIERFKQLLNSSEADDCFSLCLQIACRRQWGSEFVLALLGKVQPNINCIQPLHHAAKGGYPEVLDTLLRDDRTMANAVDSRGCTALHYACVHVTTGRVDKFEHCIMLLMYKFSMTDINRVDIRGFTAIHMLALEKAKIAEHGEKKVQATEAEDEGNGEEEDDEDHRRTRLHVAKMMLEMGRERLDLDSARAYGRTARDELLLRFPELKDKLLLPLRADPSDPHAALLDSMRTGNLRIFCALLQQTDEDGHTTYDPNHCFGPPLHATCMELACQKDNGAEFVRVLLDAGGDANTPNLFSEKYPIHMACEAGNKEVLKALLESNPRLASTDKLGNTALHTLVAVTAMDIERKACLEQLLSCSEFPVNILNEEQKSALQVALDHKNRDAVFMIVSQKSGEVNVGPVMRDEILKQFPDIGSELHESLTKEKCMCDDGGICGPMLMRQLKIKNQSEFIQQLSKSEQERINLVIDYNDNQNTLLQYAARSGLEEAVFVMLQKGANANFTFPNNPSPPFVLASQCNHTNVIKLFLDHARDLDINAADARGNTALHHAVRRVNLENVILLLQGKADWKVQNVMGKTALFGKEMKALFDKCVTTNGKSPNAGSYEIILDYRLVALPQRSDKFIPRGAYQTSEAQEMHDMLGEDSCILKLQQTDNGRVHKNHRRIVTSESVKREMRFLSVLSKSKCTIDLMQHPLVASFLDLKWQRLKIFAYLNLLLYILFIAVLNTHILYNSPKLWRNETEETGYENSTDSVAMSMLGPMIEKPVTFGLLLIIVMLFGMREVAQCLGDFKNYFTNFENVLDWATLLSTLTILLVPGASNRRMLNVLTIMLSCTGLLLFTGRISKFACNIEMLKVVLVNYLMTLVSYIIILYAFAISFYTLFRVSDPSPGEQGVLAFQTMTMSLLKVIVMMTGEFEAHEIVPHASIFGCILFVLFVMLVTIVLLNLLIGLAVSDIQKIQDDAEELRVRSHVHMVAEIESIVVRVLNQRWLPSAWRRPFQRIHLFQLNSRNGEGRVRLNQKKPFIKLLADKEGEEEVFSLNANVLNKLTMLVSKKNKYEQALDIHPT